MNAPVHIDPTSVAYTLPLTQLDVSDPKLYQDDAWYPYFERLRREEPDPLRPLQACLTVPCRRSSAGRRW